MEVHFENRIYEKFRSREELLSINVILHVIHRFLNYILCILIKNNI